MIDANFCHDRSLCRDNKYAVEKEQVIKLIRTVIEVGSTRPEPLAANASGIVPLSEPVMRSLIAIAEHVEHPFRSICIQTLAEIRESFLQAMLHSYGQY